MDEEKPPANPIRALLVDDEFDTRNIVKTLLYITEDIDLIGSCVNGREALAACAELRPDILLLDVMMPVMDGFETSRPLRERFPEIKILVLSSACDHESVQTLLRCKVNGYVSKSELPHNLAAAIRAAHSGNMVFSPDAFAALLDGDSNKNRPATSV